MKLQTCDRLSNVRSINRWSVYIIPIEVLYENKFAKGKVMNQLTKEILFQSGIKLKNRIVSYNFV